MVTAMSDSIPDELTFDPSILWCVHHAGPWIKTWPGGGAMVATVELMRQMMDELTEAVEDSQYSKLGEMEPTQLGIWIKILQPCCCFLEGVNPARLRTVYDVAGAKPPGPYMNPPV